MNVQKKPRWVALNEAGRRIGEGHGRAVLTDHEVELMLSLLAERDALLKACHAAGMVRGAIEKELNRARLSYRMIAKAMEVSPATVWNVGACAIRAQTPVKWKKV